MVVMRAWGQRASLKNETPEGEAFQRAAAPTGGSQGNRGFIAQQAGRAAPNMGRIARGGLASGVQECVPAPWQEASADPRHGGNARRDGAQKTYDALVVRDRHMMSKSGTEKQQAHPKETTSANGGRLDPLADGPVKPSFMQVNTSHYPRCGTSGTRHLDNNGPFAQTTDSLGRKQPLGTQDGTPYTVVNGGAPGLTHIYGVRGPAGTVGPELGSAADGPQKIRGGMPHGLHSRTQPNAELLAARRKSTPQQRARTASYPANSNVAGQSYSQSVMPLGGTPNPMPKTTSRRPGMQGRGLAGG